MLYQKVLFLFHRDLRSEDNTGLIAACREAKDVLPCFIFDEAQVTKKNSYRGAHALQFLRESLEDLDQAFQESGGRLWYGYGNTEEIIESLLKEEGIEALYTNREYTPFGRMRDQKLRALCTRLGKGFHMYGDCLLHEPEDIQKKDGTPYTIFTPYFRSASLHHVRIPDHGESTKGKWSNKTSMKEALTFLDTEQEQAPLRRRGGRSRGLEHLQRLSALTSYHETRNIPAIEGTSVLSPYIKFGCVSVREVYEKVKKELGGTHGLIQELHWRDFFTHIGYHFPHVFTGAFHSYYDHISWENSEEKFSAWCEGKTGFPIVDAGMRELRTTGFMHNRVRMIVASFLTKDLHISWRKGEQYFAQQLIDYDPAVNNGNWQWAASTGCDAQPYFRIFNPWRQQHTFDPEGLYCKQWIPELKHCTLQEIHGEKDHGIGAYPAPIVDHKVASAHAKIRYQQCRMSSHP